MKMLFTRIRDGEEPISMLEFSCDDQYWRDMAVGSPYSHNWTPCTVLGMEWDVELEDWGHVDLHLTLKQEGPQDLERMNAHVSDLVAQLTSPAGMKAFVKAYVAKDPGGDMLFPEKEEKE